ncbi:MAG: hypothetical protein AAGJ91_00500 [Pseudomonadota bacterium]
MARNSTDRPQTASVVIIIIVVIIVIVIVIAVIIVIVIAVIIVVIVVVVVVVVIAVVIVVVIIVFVVVIAVVIIVVIATSRRCRPALLVIAAIRGGPALADNAIAQAADRLVEFLRCFVIAPSLRPPRPPREQADDIGNVSLLREHEVIARVKAETVEVGQWERIGPFHGCQGKEQRRQSEPDRRTRTGAGTAPGCCRFARARAARFIGIDADVFHCAGAVLGTERLGTVLPTLSGARRLVLSLR